MADTTPKFTRICLGFMKRINDEVSVDVNGLLVGGNIIQTKAAIESLANKGMLEFFRHYWSNISKGNADILAALMPEMVVYSPDRQVISLAASKYSIASPFLDFYYLMGAEVNSIDASIQPPGLLSTIKSGSAVDQVKGDLNNPVVVPTGRVIRAFPEASFPTSALTLTFIKQPVEPTTGALLTQGNGASDSPFADFWENEIIGFCEQAFLNDLG